MNIFNWGECRYGKATAENTCALARKTFCVVFCFACGVRPFFISVGAPIDFIILLIVLLVFARPFYKL